MILTKLQKTYPIIDTTDTVDDLRSIVEDFQNKEMDFKIKTFKVEFFEGGDAVVTIEVETELSTDPGIWPHTADQSGVDMIPWTKV